MILLEQFYKDIQRILRFATIGFLFLMSITTWSQNNRIFEREFQEQQKHNQYYLDYYSVELSDRNIPFQKDQKWGIKNKNNEIVLAPVYDTLFNFQHGLFVAKNDSTAQLFDSQLNSYFDSSVKKITKTSVFEELKVLDKDGQESYYEIRYEIVYDNEMHQKFVYVVKAKGNLNHLLKNPEPLPLAKPRDKSRRNTTVFQAGNSYCDSIVCISNFPAPERVYEFYRKGRKYGEIFSTNILGAYSRDSVFCIETRETGLFYSTFKLYSIKSVREIISFEAVLGSLFKNDDQCYFWAFQKKDQRSVSVIYDLSGNKVVELNPGLFYEAGCLRKERNQHEGSFDLFSFPTQNLLYTNLKKVNYADHFYLFQKLDTKELLLFYNGHLLYTFSKGDDVFFFDSNVIEHSNTAVLTMMVNKQCYVFSSKRLLQVSKKAMTVHYYDYCNQMILNCGSKDMTESVKYAVYSAQEDRLQILPREFSELDDSYFVFNNNTMIFTEEYSFSDSTRVFFQDLNGSCLDETIFTDLVVHQLNDRYVIQVSANGIPRIYTGNREKICDSCYLVSDAYQAKYENYLLVNKQINQLFVEVIDETLQPVLPGKYFAVIYCESGRYFRVIDENQRIVYIPVEETSWGK